jgi:4-hydroxythreonine-4-phosphate dehydrogenase
MKRIGITSGDPDGIGLEVTAKALAEIGPQRNFRFYLFRSPHADPAQLRKISRHFRRHQFSSWAEALKFDPKNKKDLLEIVSPTPAPYWVETAAQACRLGSLDSLVTAPLSKQLIQESGMIDIGHTDILKRVTGVPRAFMGFVGKRFSVVLATAHIPVSGVSKALTADVLVAAVNAALDLRSQLDASKKRLPVALLGLNPHAGDGGLIGAEERSVFVEALKVLKSQHPNSPMPIVGPLVSDAAFLKENWSKYSVYVACYHDQGLIPFKAFHGYDSGVHLTLGLPLKRTSVDHGTAKDIFGKNKAQPGSMISALKWAMKWSKGE